MLLMEMFYMKMICLYIYKIYFNNYKIDVTSFINLLKEKYGSEYYNKVEFPFMNILIIKSFK